MFENNRNTILAVVLSGLILVAWQYFYLGPQMERQRAAQQAQAELQKNAPQPQATTTAPAGSPPARPRQHRSGRPRHRNCGHSARQDRDAERDRQHLAEGRSPRRSVAGEVPRDRLPELAADRAVRAVEHG